MYILSLNFRPTIMGSDSEDDKKSDKVVSRQPSASSKKSAKVTPEYTYKDKGDYSKGKDLDLKGKKKRITCPNCKEEIKTKIKHKAGDYSYKFMCHWCCFYTFCICCPCSWMPYAFNNWKDVYHKCPKCGYKIYKWERDYCTCGDNKWCKDIEAYGLGGKV